MESRYASHNRWRHSGLQVDAARIATVVRFLLYRNVQENEKLAHNRKEQKRGRHATTRVVKHGPTGTPLLAPHAKPVRRRSASGVRRWTVNENDFYASPRPTCPTRASVRGTARALVGTDDARHVAPNLAPGVVALVGFLVVLALPFEQRTYRIGAGEKNLHPRRSGFFRPFFGHTADGPALGTQVPA